MERFSDGILIQQWWKKFEFLKSEIKEIETHIEDDNQWAKSCAQMTCLDHI